MSNGPKLYTTQPRKAQLNPKSEEGRPFSRSEMGPPKPAAPPPSPPPSPPPKESFSRRYKYLWPVLLTVNLATGAYLFLTVNKKDEKDVVEVVDEPPASATSTIAPAVPEKTLPPQPTIVPIIPCEPIPDDEQRELFKWILEEKRKVKDSNPEEKKRLDEEKAILKQFIRAKSIPTI